MGIHGYWECKVGSVYRAPVTSTDAFQDQGAELILGCPFLKSFGRTASMFADLRVDLGYFGLREGVTGPKVPVFVLLSFILFQRDLTWYLRC